MYGHCACAARPRMYAREPGRVLGQMADWVRWRTDFAHLAHHAEMCSPVFSARKARHRAVPWAWAWPWTGRAPRWWRTTWATWSGASARLADVTPRRNAHPRRGRPHRIKMNGTVRCNTYAPAGLNYIGQEPYSGMPARQVADLGSNPKVRHGCSRHTPKYKKNQRRAARLPLGNHARQCQRDQIERTVGGDARHRPEALAAAA